MSTAMVAVPISIEQIAVAIQNMSQAEQRYLLGLVPDLQKVSTPSVNGTIQRLSPELEAYRQELLALLGNTPFSPDEPFLGGLTYAQYEALSEEDEDELWDRLGGVDLLDMEEVDTIYDEEIGDAIPA